MLACATLALRQSHSIEVHASKPDDEFKNNQLVVYTLKLSTTITTCMRRHLFSAGSSEGQSKTWGTPLSGNQNKLSKNLINV